MNETKKPIKILIADDEVEIREYLAQMLSSKYQVAFAGNGQQALEVFRTEKPQVILLDLRMPIMGGIECSRNIRSEPLGGEPLIFILTALGDQATRQQCFEVGADDFMTKPFSAAELMVRISSKLSRMRLKPPATLPISSVKFGNVMMEIEYQRVFVDGSDIELRRIEFQILKILNEKTGSICTREDLCTRIWGKDTQEMIRNLDPHISSLRKKLNKSDYEVVTKRKIGYELRPRQKS